MNFIWGEPRANKKDGTSVVFIKIYVEIWINGTSIVRSQKVMFKNLVEKHNLQMLPDVCSSRECLPE